MRPKIVAAYSYNSYPAKVEDMVSS